MISDRTSPLHPLMRIPRREHRPRFSQPITFITSIVVASSDASWVEHSVTEHVVVDVSVVAHRDEFSVAHHAFAAFGEPV